MSRYHPVLLSIGALALVAIGFVFGRYVPWGGSPHSGGLTVTGEGGKDDHLQPHEDEHVHPHEDDHEPAEAVIELSPQAFQNLGLREGPVARSDYWRTLRVPAVVIEKPGHSSHGVAAPVNGIVRRVLAVPGQAVSPGDPLVELRVTDEELSQAQLDLLQDITRLEVIATELERLAPLIADGSVSGRQQRELVYEQQQLNAKRRLHEQALLLHGLNESQVQDILNNKELVRDITVRLTAEHHAPSHPEAIPSGAANGAKANYTVEQLVALPGTAVSRGDDLCHLAYHAELYLQGQAFENELQQVGIAADRNWPISAEFGIEGEVYERPGLSIQYIDNHVDTETQTFAFYVPVVNEVTRDVVNDQGVRFRTWRFKPGQRARLKIPVERWEGQLVFPADAVVEEGLESFVFRRHVHPEPVMHAHAKLQETAADQQTELPLESLTHDEAYDLADEHAGEAHRESIELERVPVVVLHRSNAAVVLQGDGALREGDVVALNRAYELNLALKRQAGEGGHAHDHEH